MSIRGNTCYGPKCHIPWEDSLQLRVKKAPAGGRAEPSPAWRRGTSWEPLASILDSLGEYRREEKGIRGKWFTHTEEKGKKTALTGAVYPSVELADQRAKARVLLVPGASSLTTSPQLWTMQAKQKSTGCIVQDMVLQVALHLLFLLYALHDMYL